MVKKLIIAVLLCLLMLVTLSTAALAEEEPAMESTGQEAPVAEVPAEEAPVVESVTEDIPAEVTPAETIPDANAEIPAKDSGVVETGQESYDDGDGTEEESAIGERTEETDGDSSAFDTEVPVTETPGEEQMPVQQEQPTAVSSSDNTPAAAEYVVTISDGSKSVNLDGGGVHRISDILSELGYDVSDAEISPDMDSVDRKVISVNETEEGFVLTDNGRFSAADRNLIIYVNGNPVELTVVDPTPATGSMTAAQFAALFTGVDYDVLLTDNVDITDTETISITSGVHNLFLNGMTLSLGTSAGIQISGAGTVLNVYGGKDKDSSGVGTIMTNGDRIIEIMSGTVTFNTGCVLECFYGSTPSYGIINHANATVTVSGGHIVSNAGPGIENEGRLNLEDTKVYGIIGIDNKTSGSVTIKGVNTEISGSSSGDSCIRNSGTITIGDGSFSCDAGKSLFDNTGTITLSGGKYTQDISSYVAKGFIQKYDATEPEYQYSVVQSSWSYQVTSASEITATCTDSGSSVTQKLTITADAPSATYDGNPHGATAGGDTEYSAFSGNASYSVLYKGTSSSYSSAQAPTDVGTYNAELTLTAGGSTYVISAGFEIISAAPQPDPVQPVVPQKKEKESETDRKDLDKEIRLDYEDQLALNELTGEYLPIRKEIVNTVNGTIDSFRQQLESGTITQQQYDQSVETLERLTAVAAQLGSKMMESEQQAAEIQKTLPADCGVDIQEAIQEFYDNQLETLLETENGVLDLQQFEQYEEQILAAVEAYVREMFDSVLMIRNCSGTELTALIGQMVESISGRTYQDFDAEAAAEEFAENAYLAILKNLQSLVEASVNAAYIKQSGQSSLVGTAKDSLEEIYEQEMDSIQDLESFEILVMEVMRQKYVALLDSKLASGEITQERYEELMAPAADVESFAPIYRSIFHSWVLKQESEYDITLEELTDATISKATDSLKPATYQDKLTEADIRMLAIIGGVAVAGAVFAVTAVRKPRKRGTADE